MTPTACLLPNEQEIQLALHQIIQAPYRSSKCPPRVTIRTLGTVRSRIDEFETVLRPKLEEFFKTQSLAHWSPPKSASEEAQKFYQALAIPLVNGTPSLLFHELRKDPNPNGQILFEGKNKWDSAGLSC